MEHLTLYVQMTKNSKKTIEYIHSRIETINRFRAKIRIIKLKTGESPNKYADLKKHKVSSLPALKVQDRIIIGSDKIISFFETKLVAARKSAGNIGGGSQAPMDDYESFIQRQMFGPDGKPIKSEEENEAALTDREFNKRMAEYKPKDEGAAVRRAPEQTTPVEDNIPAPIDTRRMHFDDEIDRRMLDAMLGNNGGGGYDQ